ncbi:MAG: hypothetical protein ACXAB2_02315 [Candidatus Hodarchaeales archaeon]
MKRKSPYFVFFIFLLLLNIISHAIILPDNDSEEPVPISRLLGNPWNLSNRVERDKNEVSYANSEKTNPNSVGHIQFSTQEYIPGGEEFTVVNNASDVDGSPDIGVETNFSHTQASSIDSQFMQIQEAQTAAIPVAIDSVSEFSVDDSNSFNFNHTVSGINRFLIVSVYTDRGTDVISVTFAGQLLNLVNESTGNIGRPNVEIWSLVNPPTGTNNGSVTLSGVSTDDIALGVISYTGVDQTTPIGTSIIQKGKSKYPWVTVPSKSGDLVQDAMGSFSTELPSEGSGQIRRWRVQMGTTSNRYGVGSTKPGNTTVTFNWTIAVSKDWVDIGFTIQKANSPFRLDLEYQWTAMDYTRLEESLAIYTGNLGSEILIVDAWSESSTWIPLTNLTNANGWNNVSISDYLLSSTFTIRLRGSDEINDILADNWYLDTILLVISAENSPPQAENLILSPEPLLSNTTLQLNYTYSDPNNDNESGTEIRWEKWNETDASWVLMPAYITKNVTSSALIKGDIWRASVKPSDGTDFGNISYSSNITVQNTPPSVSNVEISPSDATTENELSVSYSWTDSDLTDSEVNSFIQWYLDNGSGFVLQSAQTNQSSLNSAFTNKHDKWMYNITPSDGEGFGISKISSVVTIKNSLPTLTVKINGFNSSANIDNDTNLDASYDFSDLDGDSPNVTSRESRWWRFTGGSWESYANDTMSISNGSTDINDYWYVEIRISDGSNYSSWFSSASVIIEGTPNTPPEAREVNLSLSIPIAEGFLSINYTFYDENGDDELITTFRWFKNGVYQPQYDGIKLLDILFVKNDNWTAEVRPQDDKNDYGNWTASETVKIGNTGPIVTVMEILPSEAYTTSTLTTNSIGFDIDGDPILYQNSRIVWWNGSIEVTSLENSTEVPASYTRKNQDWKYQIWLFDGTDWSISQNSSIITIKNTIPSVANVRLLGGGTSDEDIVLSYDFIDADNDTDVTSITWFVGVTSIPSSKTLSSTWYIAGDVIFCFFNPNDGEEEGETVISSTYPEGSIEVGNSAPELPSSPNILNKDRVAYFTVTTELIVNYSVFDLDETEANYLVYGIDPDVNGHVEGTLYRWFRNGALFFEGIDLVKVDISFLQKGQIWKVSVRPRDNFGTYGVWRNSSEILILNSPREIVDIWFIDNNTLEIITSNTTVTTSTLAQYSTRDPDDTDILQDFEIYWYWNNGNGSFVLRGEFNDLLLIPSSELVREHQWFVSIRLFDGEDWSNPANSSMILIVNSLPVIPTLEFIMKDDPDIFGRNDEFYVEDEDIVLEYTFEDFDGDPNLTRIQWFKQYRDEAWIEMTDFENQTIISHDNIAAEEKWFATLYPYDGFDIGSLRNTSLIDIISHPSISNLPNSNSMEEMEGRYNITVQVTDKSNPDLLFVQFVFVFNDSSQISKNGTNLGNDLWSYIFDLEELGKWELWNNLLNSTHVTVFINAYVLIDNLIQVYSHASFIFEVKDEAPPRIGSDPIFEYDNIRNPTTISVYVEVEELGAEIVEVFLYYFLSNISSSGIGSSLVQDWSEPIEMNFHNYSNSGLPVYAGSITNLKLKSDVYLSIGFQTSDSLNNTSPVVFLGQFRIDVQGPSGFTLFQIIAIAMGLIFAFITLVSSVLLIRRRQEKGKKQRKAILEKLAFIDDTYTILVSSAAGVPIWHITNVMYQSDDTLNGALSGLSVGIDSFLESFQADFLSQIQEYDLSRDHPDVETTFRTSVIEQDQVQILILGSVSYRIFVFLKEVPSTFLRETFLKIIKNLQSAMPLYQLGVINESILGPNIRRIIKRHLPIGLLEPFKIDMERLEYFNSQLKKNAEESPISRNAINVLKLLVVSTNIPPTSSKTTPDYLKMYNQLVSDAQHMQFGIMIYADAMSIITRYGNFSLESICEAFWMGSDERVKILIPV